MTSPPAAYTVLLTARARGLGENDIAKIARAQRNAPPDAGQYILEDQVGFLMRRAHQRASAIFADHFKELGLSPVQFAALTKIADAEPVSQNQLGRLIHMDPATTMAMIHRLCERELVARQPDPGDSRRVLLSVRPAGRKMLKLAHGRLAPSVTSDTLAPLAPGEREIFLRLLAKLM